MAGQNAIGLGPQQPRGIVDRFLEVKVGNVAVVGVQHQFHGILGFKGFGKGLDQQIDPLASFPFAHTKEPEGPLPQVAIQG